MRWAASDKHSGVIDKFSKVIAFLMIPYWFACVETLPATNPWGGQLPLAGCAANCRQPWATQLPGKLAIHYGCPGRGDGFKL